MSILLCTVRRQRSERGAAEGAHKKLTLDGNTPSTCGRCYQSSIGYEEEMERDWFPNYFMMMRVQTSRLGAGLVRLFRLFYHVV